jgi:hypothetical protein
MQRLQQGQGLVLPQWGARRDIQVFAPRLNFIQSRNPV